jgi:hypothetical protein
MTGYRPSPSYSNSGRLERTLVYEEAWGPTKTQGHSSLHLTPRLIALEGLQFVPPQGCQLATSLSLEGAGVREISEAQVADYGLLAGWHPHEATWSQGSSGVAPEPFRLPIFLSLFRTLASTLFLKLQSITNACVQRLPGISSNWNHITHEATS